MSSADDDDGSDDDDADAVEYTAERRLALVMRRACSISLQHRSTRSATVSTRLHDMRGSPSRDENILLEQADRT
jgi:hypothetical protein